LNFAPRWRAEGEFISLSRDKETNQRKRALRPDLIAFGSPRSSQKSGARQLADLLLCRGAPASKSIEQGARLFRIFPAGRDRKGVEEPDSNQLLLIIRMFYLCVFLIPSGDAEHRSGRRIGPKGGRKDAPTSQSGQGCAVWRARLVRDAQELRLETYFVSKRTSRR